MNEQAAISVPEPVPDSEQLWHVLDPPPRHRGQHVYTLDFVLGSLQGYRAQPEKIRRTPGWLLLARTVWLVLALLQAVLFVLAWLPIVSNVFEIAARTYTRNEVGIFLRACYWKARLRSLGQDTIIEQNVDIWGAESVSIGSHCHIDTDVQLAAGKRRHHHSGVISIGDYVHLGPGVHVAGRGNVRIGDLVAVSADAHIYSATNVIEHPGDPGRLISMSHMAPPEFKHIVVGPVVIEDYAFIGMHARIMPGVRIGRGAVVHANAEVTADVAPFGNFGGVPRGRHIGWRRPRRPSPHLRGSNREDQHGTGRPDHPSGGLPS